jgi:prevent-host-death family protein
MIAVSLTEVRASLGKVIARAKRKGTRVVLTRRGEPVAFLLSARDMEDLEDARLIEESMAEPGPNIPWEQVKKELAL